MHVPEECEQLDEGRRIPGLVELVSKMTDLSRKEDKAQDSFQVIKTGTEEAIARRKQRRPRIKKATIAAGASGQAGVEPQRELQRASYGGQQ